ncbi:hypothetical protein DAPPUDRAFT_238318 [Daphnia pulex]|uniref:Uncharacterized protein n=1 Tax=Daphnia pulex TaxID=6669 RepID=E9G641_DAPPU|nr:hypothetical protein DAPPUDRAFT_238318 [Daphnia pulex]|eukprot:EFX85058.1 hypothetical protein DAPPUDRAFT_238318 [Daphnia pulex]
MSGLFIGHPQLRKTGPRDMFEASLYCFSAAAFWLKWTSIFTLFFVLFFRIDQRETRGSSGASASAVSRNTAPVGLLVMAELI